jgi:hypothetical protein
MSEKSTARQEHTMREKQIGDSGKFGQVRPKFSKDLHISGFRCHIASDFRVLILAGLGTTDAAFQLGEQTVSVITSRGGLQMRNTQYLPGSLILRILLPTALLLIFFGSPLPLMADSFITAVGAIGNEGGGDGVPFATISNTGPGFSASGTAMASLALGSFGVEASFDTTSGASTYGNGFAQSYGVYDLGVPNGPSTGTVVLQLTATGTTQSTLTGCVGCIPDEEVEFQYTTDPQSDDPAFYTSGEIDLSSGATVLDVSIPYDPSNAPDVSLSIFVNVSCVQRGEAGTCSAEANFLDPLQITGAQVYDSSGNLVPGAEVISESGFNPNNFPVMSTPEPSSLLLMTVGLLFVGVAFMRKRFAYCCAR